MPSVTPKRACGSAGRAPRSHRGGQGFESPQVHTNTRFVGRIKPETTFYPSRWPVRPWRGFVSLDPLNYALADYLRDCQVRGLSRRTVVTYRTALQNLLASLPAPEGSTRSLDALTTPVIRQWVYSMVEKKLRPRTLRTRLIAVRSFCAFLAGQGLLPDNPALPLKLPRRSCRHW
jgi:integrase